MGLGVRRRGKHLYCQMFIRGREAKVLKRVGLRWAPGNCMAGACMGDAAAATQVKLGNGNLDLHGRLPVLGLLEGLDAGAEISLVGAGAVSFAGPYCDASNDGLCYGSCGLCGSCGCSGGGGASPSCGSYGPGGKVPGGAGMGSSGRGTIGLGGPGDRGVCWRRGPDSPPFCPAAIFRCRQAACCRSAHLGFAG